MSTSALPNPASTSRSGEPRLSPAAIVALGDGLIAISNELHTTAAAESHSLNSWLQWLDDEGYDGRQFVEALQGLYRQQLDAATYAQLQATARARADQPEGMQQAIDHLNEIDPVLLEEILKIEQTRQEQLQVLNARAGGVNTKKVGIHTAEAAGAALVGFGVYKLVQRCRRPVEREVLRGDEMAHEAFREAPNFVRDPKAERVLKQDGAITLKKEVDAITPADILKIAKDFSFAHQEHFPERFGRELMDNEITKLYHQSPEIKGTSKNQQGT